MNSFLNLYRVNRSHNFPRWWCIRNSWKYRNDANGMALEALQKRLSE